MSDVTAPRETNEPEASKERLSNKEYLKELQDWVKATGRKIIIVFEGREAAGKGGLIRALTERVSPRDSRLWPCPRCLIARTSSIFNGTSRTFPPPVRLCRR